MYYDFDGEKINLVNFTPIDNKETRELQELKDRLVNKYSKMSGPFNIWFILLGIIIGISIPLCFVATACLFITFAGFIGLIILALVKANKCAHLGNQIKIANNLLATAIHNDRVRHDEKLRLLEREKLLESNEMKQVEIKTDLKEGKLPFRPER